MQFAYVYKGETSIVSALNKEADALLNCTAHKACQSG